MSRIKTRESVKDIKVIDKAAVASERMKTALVRSKAVAYTHLTLPTNREG